MCVPDFGMETQTLGMETQNLGGNVAISRGQKHIPKRESLNLSLKVYGLFQEESCSTGPV